MGDTGKAFNEVKQLLGRLDRSIDEARSRRIGPAEPARPVRPILPRASQSERMIGSPAPQVPAAPVRQSQYGRAKPLRPQADEPRPTGAWTKPEPAPKRTWDDDTMIG